MGLRGKQKSEGIEDFSILDLGAFFLRSWRWIALYVALFGAVTIHHHRKNPSYTSYGSLLLEGTRPHSIQAMADKYLGGGSIYESKEEQIERYLTILNSHKFLELVADHVMRSPDYGKFLEVLQLGKPDSTNYSREQVVDFVRGSISIAKQGTEFIRVSATNPVAWKSVILANIGLEAVKNAIVDRESADATGGREFIDQQLKDIEMRVKLIDDEIVKNDGSLRPDGPESRQSGESKVADLMNKFLEKKVRLGEAESQLKELEEKIKDNPPPSSSSIDKYSPEMLLSDMRRKVYLIRKEHDAYKRVIDITKRQGMGAPAAERKLMDLYKKKEMEYHLYTEFKRELSLMNIQMISVRNRVKVLEPAQLGSASSKDLVPDLVKRSILAVLLALVTVYFLENYNPVVRSRRELEGMPMFFVGSVPRMEKLERKRYKEIFFQLFPVFDRRKKNAAAMRNVELQPDSVIDLIFKNIRAHVVALGSQGERKPKIISVVSPVMGEGKTFLSNGLAKSLASGGARVLLVDCDIRRRSLSQSWGLDGEVGFAEYLAAPYADFQGKVVKTVTKRLDVLPAGKYVSNCAELVASVHFAEAMEALAKFYDFIVIDTPPVVAYSEVLSIAAVSDLLLFSFTVKQTTLESVEKAMERLRFVSPTPAIGYVLNKYDSFSAYSYYYSQSGESEKESGPDIRRVA